MYLGMQKPNIKFRLYLCCLLLLCFPQVTATQKENSPFINNTDNDKASSYDGKNMALFEVTLWCRGIHMFSCIHV